MQFIAANSDLQLCCFSDLVDSQWMVSCISNLNLYLQYVLNVMQFSVRHEGLGTIKQTSKVCVAPGNGHEVTELAGKSNPNGLPQRSL